MKQTILLLGGNGYIGSRLRQVLRPISNLTSVDCCWYNYDETCICKDYHELTRDDLKRFEVVIVLAGHSSVPSCNGPMPGPWLNNVTNFTDLLSKLDDNVLVIYASSASVYGNSKPGELHTEKNDHFVPVNNYDVTKYALDQQAMIANLKGKRVIGLRFGTVNGWAPILRVDVMINAMYETVQQGRSIQVTNKHISRAILGIEDLCRAVTKCIENPVPGIYNLASFNSTVDEISQTVADKLNVKIEDCGRTGNAYDFGLDTSLFEQTYNFTFSETPAIIIDGLIEMYNQSEIGRRDNYMIYNWKPTRERR